MVILGYIIAAESALMAAPILPVIIPDSSWKVTEGKLGTHAHTRVRILDTASATTANTSQYNSPITIRSAYNLPATGGAGAIAIVDAYNYPTALGDFNTFGKKYGLPVETSTNVTQSSNKVFQIVYARGRPPMSGGSYIASWNLEEALDIEWAHSVAPGAKIYLVEAASDSMSDLLYAVQVASNLPGVHQVSMSWGSDEIRNETSFDGYFTTTGVTYFAAGGDSTDDLEYPAASPNVISVGGTSLNRNNAGALTSETVWDDTGCGISRYETRPKFQDVLARILGNHRGSNDVAFVADPNTGVYVYDSTYLYGQSGWWIVGGTSLGTPAWAGVVNLASVGNKVAANTAAEGARIYGNLGDGATFRDVTSGADGDVSGETGWDEPTGIGSPLGLTGK